MKKLLIVSSILVAFAISCEDVTVQNNNVQTVEITTITAESNSNSEQTKTLLDEGMKTNWIAGDAINVFFGASESGVFTTEDSGDIAQFKGYISVVTGGGESLTDETSLWGVYPYSKDTKCDGTNITYTLPSIQASKADSFADDLFPQIAKSKNFYMSFYNLCGLIRFKVASEDIVKVKIKGKNEESLAGTALVGMDDVPFVKEITDGKSELEMSAPDGECFNTDAYYYFVLYPTNFTEGLTITYYKENSSASYDISTYNLARNKCASITDKDAGLTFSDDDSGTDDEETDDELYIPVTSISIQAEKTKFLVDETLSLSVIIIPSDATNQDVIWSSDNPTVASINQAGLLTTHSKGTAIISARTDGVVGNYEIQVIEALYYIDEYGVNHGRGIFLGNNVWAPVNCGYKAPTYDNDNNIIDKGYPYGKHYQWGRQYGQGLSGEYDNDVIEITPGRVSLEGGQHKSNANKFYMKYDVTGDWLATLNNKLWNNKTNTSPEKGQFDPCPEGWRIPTDQEMKELILNSSGVVTLDNGQTGIYFSGLYNYSSTVPCIFLPMSGWRRSLDGEVSGINRFGDYWTSTVDSWNVKKLILSSDFEINLTDRANGLSVRCIQE